MLKAFAPRLDILPRRSEGFGRSWRTRLSTLPFMAAPQSPCVWDTASPSIFFFSPAHFEPKVLLEAIPYLKDATVRKSGPNDLAVTVERGGPVQLSFFGNFDLGQVAEHELAEGPRIKVASLVDLGGMKVAVVTQRAEVKDYLDVDSLLTRSGMPLPDMLAAAAIIYGDQFAPLLSLKAIAYHDDPSLAGLPMDVRNRLSRAVQSTDPAKLPKLDAIKVRGGRQ